MAAEFRGTEVDDLKLMRQIAKMANMEFAGIRKMALVLEVGALPVLFVESYLQPVGDEQLVNVPLEVEHVQGIIVDTTTMQNKEWVTHSPIKREG